MTKVCRLCLQRLQRGSKYFNINAVESFTGFMPYRDQLTTCIPEMALDLIPNPVICNACRTALKSAYEFKSRCLLVEKKIREYVESQPSDKVNYELSQISISDLPPVPKSPPKELPEKETTHTPTPNDSELLLQLQKEVILPTTGEIEITNVTTSVVRAPRKKIHSEVKDGPHTCGRCGINFPDVGKLVLHKTVHGEEFVCNFCNRSFKSLQYLRKHNNMCSKIKNKTEVNPILTKRPHLPTKAKNHLKRWLFRHTDHPYPTDHEKQILMQETNLSLLQVENWFINARRRILQDLTKLKKHGAKCDCYLAEDIGEDVLDLHTEMDLDELPASRTSPIADTSTSPSPSEGETAAACLLKAEEAPVDPLFTPVDIMVIKKEIMDDR
ncbi:uncharacterized protein LOC108908029 isoform X2 [Anoplophora glabripennis]|uniref:uncharacterized protein LOC108908029 isoform X2 n=1 Tax=Anoplophora glabripennis TaxID=217634 RepID=UPI00087429D8|nr:uncharacterized protein LOC108908029 isoform X2 [Anoplophora glabripennis]